MIAVKSLKELDNGALLEIARDLGQVIQDDADQVHIKANAVELNRVLNELESRRSVIEIQGEVR